MRRLTRSRRNNVIAGVCGGLGEYFNVDPIVVRILWIAAGLITAGTAVIAYIIAAIVIPDTRSENNANRAGQQNQQWEQPQGHADQYSDINAGMEDWKEPPKREPDNTRRIIGIGLVVMGAFFLIKEIFNWADMRIMVPVALVVIGGAIIYKGRRNPI